MKVKLGHVSLVPGVRLSWMPRCEGQGRLMLGHFGGGLYSVWVSVKGKWGQIWSCLTMF